MPAALATLNLTELSVESNQLQGPLPEFCGIPSAALRVLAVASNSLSGLVDVSGCAHLHVADFQVGTAAHGMMAQMPLHRRAWRDGSGS
jgi:hypothetical protein